MIRFTVPGKPLGKGRGRTAPGLRGVYTPAKTVAYESRIALFASQAMAGRAPLVGPLSVSVKAVFEVPKSWPKKNRMAALAGGPHTGKPDGDNIAKCVGDAGNGVLWHDDSSIARLLVVKQYGPVSELVVEVDPLGGAL